MTNEKTTYEWAKEYIDLGWSIIPIIPGEKRPAVAWNEYRTRYATEEELQEWFVKNHHEIGIVTGKLSRLFVVDFDDNTHVNEFLAKYPTDLVAKTPRGGFHLVYEYEGDDLGPSVGKLGYKIDTRGEGGYIVAPSGNGSKREWDKFGRPKKLPDSLRQQAAATNGSTPEVQQAGGKEDGADLMARIMANGFTSGQHNVELKDAGRFLYRQGLNYNVIKQMLWVLNQKDETPLPLHEFEATLNSGIKYERDRIGAKNVDEVGQTVFEVNSFGGVAVNFEDYDVNWLVEEWLPENAILALSAPPEHYKTWVLLELAVNVAMGGYIAPFLGQFNVVGEPKPVLIIQQEDYMGMVVQRLRTIVAGKAGMSLSNPHEVMGDFGLLPLLNNIYILEQGALAFDQPGSLERLEATIQQYGIKLVVIDPLYMLAPSDDFFASAARKMGLIKDIRNRQGCAFVIAHHNRKSGGEGRDKIWGSQLLNGAFEGAWLIDKEDGTYTISRSGKFFQDKKRFSLIFEINTKPQEAVYKTTTEAIGVESLTGTYDRDVVEFFETVGNAKQGEVAEYLTDKHGKTIQSGHARKILDKLVEKKILATDGAGRAPKFWLNTVDLEGA